MLNAEWITIDEQNSSIPTEMWEGQENSVTVAFNSETDYLAYSVDITDGINTPTSSSSLSGSWSASHDDSGATVTLDLMEDQGWSMQSVWHQEWTVQNIQPTATLDYDPGDGGGEPTLSLDNPVDPSSADTTAGFRYSSAGLYGDLAASYGEASTGHSFEVDAEDADNVIWIRIFDQDGGYSDYNSSYVLPTVNLLNVTADAIAISWNADVVDDETGWIVQRALASGGAYSTVDTLAGNAGSYVDDSVNPDTRYIYRVRATGNGADTAYSAKRFVRTLMPTPTNVAATEDPDAGTVELSWDAASGYTYDHFEIGVYTGGQTPSDDSFMGSVDVDGGLRSYTFNNPSRLPLQFSLVATSSLDNSSVPTPPTESVITGWGWVTIGEFRHDLNGEREDLFDPVEIPGVDWDLDRNPPFEELEEFKFYNEDTAVWTVSGLPHHSRIRVAAADVSAFGETDDGSENYPLSEIGPHVTAQIIGSGALVPELSRLPRVDSLSYYFNDWKLVQATAADRYYQHYGSKFKLAQTGYLLDEAWEFRPDNLVLQLYMPVGVPNPDWDRNAPPPPPNFNTPDPDPPLPPVPPLPPLPPEEPPIEPIEEVEPEPEPSDDPELTENWDNLVIGGWDGFWSQYGWPYNTASTIGTMGYSNSDDETEPGNPPPLSKSVFIPVNDGLGEGNEDYQGNPLPDNVADAFVGHRVDYDVAPMWLDLWSTDEGTSAGSVSLDYDDSKIMLWIWSEDEQNWVELDSSTISLETEKWSGGAYERLYFLVEGIAGSEAVHDVPVTALFSKGDAGTAEDTAGFTVVSISITAEVIVQDDPTDTTYGPLSPLSDGKSVIYGGSAPGTSDDLKLTIVVQPAALSGAAFEWTTSKSAAVQFQPSSASGDPEYLVGNIAALPGDITFGAIGTFGSQKFSVSTKFEIGVRTDDVVVASWIDPSLVPAPTPGPGVGSDIVAGFPPTGAPVGNTNLGIAATIIAQLAGIRDNNIGYDWTTPDDSPFRPTDLLGNTPLTGAERVYLINWLFKYGANTDPTLALAGGNFRDTSNLGTDESKVAAFLATTTNYKLFNRLQVRYRKGTSGFKGTPTVLHQSAAVGNTVDPLGLPPYIHPGQVGPAMMLNGAFKNANRVSSIVDGSPAADPIRAFNTLTGMGVVSPVYWENIGNRITFNYDGNTAGSITQPDLFFQPYPTHYVYLNGILSPIAGGKSVVQALSPFGNFVANAYPFGPGGRNGDGHSAAATGARIPLYTVP